MRRWFLHVAVTAAIAAVLTCGTDPREEGAPERYCPGRAGCADDGDGVLFAGAAAVAITPSIDDRTEIQTVDVNGNGEFDPRQGDAFADKNGDGKFDGEWIAGFGHGRAARGVNDEQWARAIALRHNQTTIVLVALDAVGYFYDEVQLIREMVKDLDVDYVAVGATHSHESRDTLGIWGVSEDSTGVSATHMAFIRVQAAKAIRDAVAALEPASIKYARFRTRDLPGGMMQYQSDTRDPKIIDDEVRLIELRGASKTIATLINWGSHPEYIGDENQLLSSDYPHWLREGVEKGVTGPEGARAGRGGVAVFFAGALGSQIGPGRVRPRAFDVSEVPRNSIEAARTVGTQLAYAALAALEASAAVDSTAPIGFGAQSFYVDIQNRAYHTALLKKLFDRKGYNWDDEAPLIPGQNEPDVITEIATIDIGRAQIITVPGELDPSLFLGGYDGSHTPTGELIVDPSQKNPPDLGKAPPGPYLKDLARSDAEYVFLFGLTNDMLGYFLPEFDYVLHPRNPYFDEAEGDHYEETNSVGIDGWPRIKGMLTQLLAWRSKQRTEP